MCLLVSPYPNLSWEGDEQILSGSLNLDGTRELAYVQERSRMSAQHYLGTLLEGHQLMPVPAPTFWWAPRMRGCRSS